MVKKKNSTLRYLKIQADSLTPGANLGFVEFLDDLSDRCESDLPEDSSGGGMAPKIHNCTVTIETFSASDHIISAACVQCSSNFVDTVNQAGLRSYELLDASAPDVYGTVQGPVMKSVPFYNGTAYITRTRIVWKLPQKVIEILNKTTQTERLQNLQLIMYGRSNANTVIDVFYTIWMDYELTQKGAVLR